MKCTKCGRDFPSDYYLKTESLCLECYGKMNPEEQRKAIFDSLMKHPLTSTYHAIDGYRVVKHFGVVRGITVRSRSIFGRLGAELQTIVGGNITMFTELCEKTRAEAFDMTDGVTEVLCYGTAVLVEPA